MESDNLKQIEQLRNELKTIKSKKNIYAGIANVQQSVSALPKDKSGYGYNYTEFSSIVQAINPLMKESGLGFYQGVEMIEGVEYVFTIIFHFESGEELKTKIKMPSNISLSNQNQFQVLGSAITYFKRYLLSSMLGIVTEEDTDATKPKKETPKKSFQKPAPKPAVKKAETPSEPMSKKGDALFEKFTNLVLGAAASENKSKALILVEQGAAKTATIEKWIPWLEKQKTV